MKQNLLTGFSAGLLVWAIVGITNSYISKAGEMAECSIPIPDNILEGPPPPATLEIDVNEMHCLAKNIYFEARGESLKGKIAVANVTMNRVDSPKYPNTICGVVYQAKYSKWWQEHNGSLVPIRNQCQFSWYCDGKIDALYLTNAKGEVIKGNMQAWTDSLQIAEDSIRGNITDITLGATHYFNPDLADPYWAYHYTKLTEIESHDFYIHY